MAKGGWKNAGILAAGQLAARAIGVAALLVVPRVLGAEKYGQYTTVLASVSLFSVLTFAGYKTVILRECSKDAAAIDRVFNSCSKIRIISSLLAVSVCIGFAFVAPYTTATKQLIALLSLQLFFRPLEETFNVVFFATERVGTVAALSVTKAALLSLGSILVAVHLQSVSRLVFLNVLVAFSSFALSYRFSKRVSQGIKIWDGNSPIVHFGLLKQGLVFSLLQFLNVNAKKIDLVMLSILGTQADVGVYALAYRIVEKGALLKGAIFQSFFPVFSKRIAAGRLTAKELNSMFFRLAGVLVVFTTLASLLSESIFGLLFGKSFMQSADIFRVLIFYLFLTFIIIPFSLVLRISHRESLLLRAKSVQAIVNVASNYVFFQLFGRIGIAYSTLVTYSVYGVLVIVLGYRCVLVHSGDET